MTRSRSARLTSGSVARALAGMTLPMIAGILGMSIFNLIDTFFIGQLGARELAAISFTFPVILVIGSIAMGLGIGASSVISRAIGEENQQKVQRLTTDALILSSLIVLIFVITGMMTIEPLFLLLGAEKDLLPMITDYMVIWYIGVPFLVIPMVGNNAIRATGDTITPSKIMLLAIAVNMGLDPLLIFGIGPFPRLELTGAALATAFARASAMTASLYVLYKREKMISFNFPSPGIIAESWKSILYIGLPAAGTNLIVPVSIGILTRLISGYGSNAVAAYGVGTRIEMFALAVTMALSSVLGPFVGQNWGAGRMDRVRSGIQLSQVFSMGWGAFVFIMFFIFAKPLACLFNDCDEIAAIASLFLIIVSASYGLNGILRLAGTALNALNKPFQSAALSTLHMFILTVPLAVLGKHFFGLTGIFTACAAANVISGTAAFFLLKNVNKAEADLKII